MTMINVKMKGMCTHQNKWKKGGMGHYRYSVPLQSPSQRLLDSIWEKLDVLGQHKALHQALGNPPPITLGPCPYASGCWKRLVLEHEGGLPPRLELRGRCYVGPYLGTWPRITSWLSNRDPAWHPGKGPWGSVTRNPRRLISDMLFLFNTAD